MIYARTPAVGLLCDDLRGHFLLWKVEAQLWANIPWLRITLAANDD